MVGAGVLLECLDDASIDSIVVVGRRTTGVRHSKITELIHGDFFNWAPLRATLADCDACYFCLGVSSAGMSEQTYYHLTYDLTISAAEAVIAASPKVTFCYVSGAGTDSTEQGRVMWARVKGKTENALLRMPFRGAYMLRPGYIQALRGVRSSTGWYRAIYTVVSPIYPVLSRLLPRYVTTTANIGRAMIQLATVGYSKRILYSPDINRLALDRAVRPSVTSAS